MGWGAWYIKNMKNQTTMENINQLAALILDRYPGMDLAEAIELFQQDARNGKFGAVAQDYQLTVEAE